MNRLILRNLPLNFLKKYTLNIITSEKNQVTVNERIISVGLKRYSDERKGEQFFKDWLRYEATLSIKGRLNEILARFDNYRFAPSAIQVKNMKRRWGSCSSGGKITINAELIKLDDIFTEYVILHELCHLYYHNHGKEYYRLLAEVFPDWKAIRKRLRLYHA
jgi:predicted metal-dependent hydrolase